MRKASIDKKQVSKNWIHAACVSSLAVQRSI